MAVAPLCLASNLYQPKLSLLIYFESANHFTLPIVTMSEQCPRNGTACKVDTRSAGNSSQVTEMLWKCGISLCSASRVYGGFVMIASIGP